MIGVGAAVGHEHDGGGVLRGFRLAGQLVERAQQAFIDIGAAAGIGGIGLMQQVAGACASGPDRAVDLGFKRDENVHVAAGGLDVRLLGLVRVERRVQAFDHAVLALSRHRTGVIDHPNGPAGFPERGLVDVERAVDHRGGGHGEREFAVADRGEDVRGGDGLGGAGVVSPAEFDGLGFGDAEHDRRGGGAGRVFDDVLGVSHRNPHRGGRPDGVVILAAGLERVHNLQRTHVVHRHGYVGLVGRFLDGDGDFLVFGAGGNAQGGSRFAAGRLEGLRGGGRAVAVRCAVIGIIERRATGQREHAGTYRGRNRGGGEKTLCP